MTDVTDDTATDDRKETAAQRVERIKREKAPWSIMDDIRRYAREGFASIPVEDLGVRFRAWGLYTQGDGRGTRGEEQPFFMMRVRTPNGLLTSAMVRTIADLADRYARGAIDITNRQNFQLHWLRIEDIPTVWDALSSVGWTSQGACGDNTRTVTGCPLAGVDHEELIDASPIALAVDRFLNGNADYANLPRKFKITITGCAHWCTYPEINDVGATAVRRADGVVGFHVRVGGGLSTRPHLAVKLPAFVLAEQLPEVVNAIVGIFRDSDELRQNRAKARMKFLFINHGWTADSFLAEIERRVGYSLAPAVEEHPPEGRYRDHLGVQPQKQPGLHYAAFSVLSGRIDPERLRAVARLADTYGDGSLRLTATQNVVVPNIPAERLTAFEAEAAVVGALRSSPFQRGTVSCTGSEFCKLAIVETKQFSIRLAEALEARLPGFSESIKLHVTGCPNACGQHWIADVGLQGVLLNQGGEQVEGFDVFVGGGLGAHSATAHRVGFRASADALPDALERLFSVYDAERDGDESFREWTSRVGDAAVKAALAGVPAAPSLPNAKAVAVPA
ncbi:nitrite/sulfite reductase hemoprotein beta-component ferrodoxin domain protein [Gemmatirosa kalamazoonensis]|uniref:Nitrite/sulfite reductase hemoprotein beta-component ferrodoxin domain protein n=1 Tax=Gemmatirosa kalamazoonensis TaxID=861299 RepID=W0RC07_9BACT|nr:nitrite/sulfite reductase [Gemmatirosa kalamazoonensis]AHG88639.1 nitrite/sulfite reductase hemoprotein beta-component ferrodoxin domain protein [Gemmatirosa kalamazoonensis]